MLTGERLDRIRGQLRAKGKVLATELALQFDVSEDTIRRDLRELAKLGECRKVYGGALRPTPDLGTLADRSALQQGSKCALARTAAGLVKSGQTIFIDAGSTNLAIARALPLSHRLTIVTNAPSIATALSEHPNCTILMLGGTFDPVKGACLGPQAIREASQIFADLFILAACGVDTTAGVTALDVAEAELKRTLINQSSLLLVAATAEKLGTVAPFKIAEASALDHLIVESNSCDTAAFERASVEVHVVQTA
jgi:DeoR/GlpR family transcriptional regulator of sugar metabolism